MWNGETIAMKPHEGGDKEFFAKVYYYFVESDLWTMFTESTPCDWKKLPQTIAYVEEEKKAYVAREGQAATYAISSIRDLLIVNDPNFVRKGCGSPREYFAKPPARVKPGTAIPAEPLPEGAVRYAPRRDKVERVPGR